MLCVLQFDYAWWASPAEAGLDPDDHRQIAVFFQSLDFASKKLWFHRGGSAGDHILFGFWQPEERGAWSQGRRSALIFDLPDGPAPADELIIESSAFRQAQMRCKASVLCSDGRAAKLCIESLSTLTARLKAPWLGRSRRTIIGGYPARRMEFPRHAPKERPAVSIILTNYNKALMTRLSAQAASAAAGDLPAELLCVDNGSDEHCRSALQAVDDFDRIFFLPERRSFAAANNAGALEASGEYLLFLNNDAFVASGAIQELLEAFVRHPDCGASGLVLYDMDNNLQEAGCSLTAEGFSLRRGRGDAHFRLGDLPRFQPVDYISAACLMVRRTEFLAMGGFQEKYDPAYYEDTDFCLRLLLRRKRVYLASQTGCHHIENATSRQIEDGAWATRTSEKHRVVFLQDWAPYLTSRHPADFPKL